MKRRGILLLVILFLSGCGQVAIESPVQTDGLTGEFDLSLVEEVQVIEEVVPANWETYVNDAFAFQFSYPSDGVLWTQISAGETAYVIPPTVSSTRIHFTDANVNRLLDTEVNRLTIEVIEGERSAHEWLSQNLETYFENGNAGQTTSTFAGEEAIVLVGSGGYYSNSPAKMIIVQGAEVIYAIHYLSDSFTFEDVLNTFTFL